MLLLHTADWHLCDRLGRIDRTEDLRKAVERIAALCEEHRVDVLLIAGDLFSEAARPEALRESMTHLNQVFRPFLTGGGTIVAVTGNHDNETFCRTLQEAFRLASPTAARVGDVLPSGRLHLATGPTHFRLADRAGQVVQFACLPYPTGQRYLEEPHQRFASVEQRNRALRDACEERLLAMQKQLDPTLPSVVAAHVYVLGTAVRGLFRLSEQDDIVFNEQSFASGWTYAALGHIHRPQAVGAASHVRYSGSIERLDLGERDDEKSAVLVNIGPHGLLGEPEVLPLAATPIYDVVLTDPQADLLRLAALYPDADRALARLHVTYRPGEDNLPQVLAALDRIFPRWYSREHLAYRPDLPRSANGSPAAEQSHINQPSATVRRYLERMLPADDEDRKELIALATELVEDDQ